MRDVIDVVVDDVVWFEVQPDVRRGGGLRARAPRRSRRSRSWRTSRRCMAGSIDVDGADKAAHFITVADSFHLPLVFLADNPGVLPGTRRSGAGILRSGARMFAAQTVATTPKFEVDAAQGVRVRLDGHGR